MEITTETLEETLVFLIQNADPSGSNHPKLMKILDQVRRNVFIGPSARKFIASCVSKFDNVECNHLAREGYCKAIKGAPRCPFREKFSECGKYSKEKDATRGTVIKLGGLNV